MFTLRRARHYWISFFVLEWESNHIIIRLEHPVCIQVQGHLRICSLMKSTKQTITLVYLSSEIQQKLNTNIIKMNL